MFMDVKLESFQLIYAIKVATFNHIIYECKTCKKDIDLHSRAKHTLTKKHFQNLSRIETQNMKKGEP